jgi:hypothetical protein
MNRLENGTIAVGAPGSYMRELAEAEDRKLNPQPIPIRSRAELLRTIKTPNLQIQVLNHWQEHLRGTTRIPKAIRNSGKPGIQTNGYYFDSVDKDGKPCEMWAEFPPASKLAFNQDGTVTFHPGTDRQWTLAFSA